MHNTFCTWLTSPQTSLVSVYSAAAGTIFGNTDEYELSFSYLSISIFKTSLMR